jgi:hypothetical protein
MVHLIHLGPGALVDREHDGVDRALADDSERVRESSSVYYGKAAGAGRFESSPFDRRHDGRDRHLARSFTERDRHGGRPSG